MKSIKETKEKVIYHLKITLRGSKPTIWRRIQVASDIKLSTLHDVIQITMGWEHSHLHQFIVDGVYYGEIFKGDFDTGDTEDEKKVKLFQVMEAPKSKIFYEYDFGDSWEHEIVLEEILPATAKKVPSVCLAGERACPPEDCGGVWGYEELLRVIKNPTDPDYEDRMEWLGDDFDPEVFDINEVNEILKLIK